MTAWSYDALKKITEHDETLKYFLAVRHAKSKHNIQVLAGAHTETLRILDKRLFRSTTPAVTVQQNKFDDIFNHVDSQHHFLFEVVSEAESTYGRTNLMRYLRYYIDGYCAAEIENKITANDLLDLWPVIDVFNSQLTKAEQQRQKFTGA